MLFSFISNIPAFIFRRRYDFQKHIRKLVENDFENSTDEETVEGEEEEEMEWRPPTIKLPRAYKNQIMLSEWLVDIPTDFETHWFMVPSPIGKRCLVVANKVIVLFHCTQLMNLP